jgi:hypothetical protein
MKFPMNCIKIIAGSILLLNSTIPLFSQSNWELKNDKDGIRISLRKDAKTSFDDVRVELDVPGTLEQLQTIILDVGNYSQWICSTKKSVLIKQVNDRRCVYFTEVSLPWPFSNRYYYSDLTLKTDSINHSFHVVTKSTEGDESNIRDLVKITYTRGEWQVNSKAANFLHIEYTLEMDPGGSVTPWLFNMFVINGPRETFEKIRNKMSELNK